VDLKIPGIICPSGIGVTVEPQQEKDMYFIARLPGRFGLVCADPRLGRDDRQDPHRVN
jgi:hypothetical protein